jgi:hypothetical protein
VAALMISRRTAGTACPMPLPALHPNVAFHFHRPAIGTCGIEMH